MPAAPPKFDLESPAFAAHFGRLLVATRHTRGCTRRTLVAADDRFSVAELRQIERGRLHLDESVIDGVCQVYGADLGALLPSRNPVSIVDGMITADGVRASFSPTDPASLLDAYLRLIRQMRHQRRAPAVALRRDDIEAIADFLALPGAEIVDRLAALMGATAAQRSGMAMLFASGAIVIGLAVGTVGMAGHASAAEAPPVDTSLEVADPVPATAADPVVVDTAADVPLVSAAADPIVDTAAEPAISEPAAAVAPDAATAIPTTTEPVAAAVPVAADSPVVAQPVAEPVVAAPAVATGASTLGVVPVGAVTDTGAITAAAVSSGLAPAVRMSTPQPTTAPAVVPEVTNESGCSTDGSAAVMSVVIPDISYSCPVYAGGQALIDDGYVALVTDAGSNSLLATHPGESGTLWLAAHRTAHGGAFAEVPDLADGALITIADGDTVATYRVVGREYVTMRGDRVVDASGNATADATWDSIVRADRGGNGAARLVLQTCDGNDYRWMIYADLVTS
jgi:sortase (surface protein transpeptidase)